MRTFKNWMHILALLVLFVREQHANCEENQEKSYGRAWIESSFELETMTVLAIKHRFCRRKSLLVQIWNSDPTDALQYRLRWQKVLEPGGRLGEFQKTALKEAEVVEVGRGDRVGLYVPDEGEFPVSTVFSSSGPYRSIQTESRGPFDLGSLYQFSDLKRPVHFDLEICADKDCNRSLRHPAKPRPSVPSSCRTANLQRSDGRVLLERSRKLGSGVVTHIRLKTCSRTAMKVQLWQPLNADLREFRLVWQFSLSGKDEGDETTIEIPPEQRIFLEPSYRLGVQTLQPNDSTPVTTSFRGFGANMVRAETTEVPVSLCRPTEFEELAYPLQFSLTFCFSADCEQNLGAAGTDEHRHTCSSLPQGDNPNGADGTDAPNFEGTDGSTAVTFKNGAATEACLHQGMAALLALLASGTRYL